MEPIDSRHSVVTSSGSADNRSEQARPLAIRPSSPTPAAPLDPERVTISKLHTFRTKYFGPSELPSDIKTTLTFLYSRPNILTHAVQENDLELLNILLDISIKHEGDNILHRMAELKQHIASYADLLGNNVFLALAKNRWPEAHLAPTNHKMTWTADQWLTFLEDIKDTPAIGYTPFNVSDIPSSDWEEITKDWDPEKKMEVFYKLIHLSSVQRVCCITS